MGRLHPANFSGFILKFNSAYYYQNSYLIMLKGLTSGHMMKSRPEALIFGYQKLQGWTVMNRLGEIKMPTLILAGRYDFLFPTEHQVALAAGIPNARLEIIENAGHVPHLEQLDAVQSLIRNFLANPSSSLS